MGEYDAPAQFMKALEVSGKKSGTWIGHSQGSTQMFYALSKNADFWKDKLDLFVALAPATRMKHCSSQLLSYGSKAIDLITDATRIAGLYSLLEPGISSDMSRLFCGFIPKFCDLL
jgi:hypothetical protein